MGTGAGSLGCFTRKQDTSFCAPLDYARGPIEIAETVPMSHDGENGSGTPRLHWVAPLHHYSVVLKLIHPLGSTA